MFNIYFKKNISTYNYFNTSDKTLCKMKLASLLMSPDHPVTH